MLTRKEKLKKIKEICNKHQITAYELAKKTNISSVGIQNILTGVSKKPREETINKILNFLEEQSFTNKQTSVNESESNYNTTYKIDGKPTAITKEGLKNVLKTYIKILDKIQKGIKQLNIKGNDIETIKNLYEYNKYRKKVLDEINEIKKHL